ncbi:hypothetical protein GS501_06920 [Saccharibacter sp. 17.LH.SD]|uniref:hypothetical protein n=1 Tax=Saccharibacter sp. 17.LH.SD TaxID=2689393 RepID=UPI0013682351|nr:hypothetical protein [Saccharibacter sp. 17.LH.SD]MXV44767.1 hypothetical protein [Saccharibacter sp. 17.LH.SD]
MSHQVIEVLQEGAVSFCQLVILCLLTPFFTWALEVSPVLLSGRTVPRLGQIYRQFISFFRHVMRQGLPPAEGVSFSLAMIVFIALPGCVVIPGLGDMMLFPGPLGDILLVGGILLWGGFCLMPAFFLGRYVGAIVPLCMAEALLVLAAPGVYGLSGIHTVLRLLPGSGLAGASICCALALAVSSPLPTVSELTELMMSYRYVPTRDGRDCRRVLVRFLQMGWLLLVADLLFPVLSDSDGWASIVELVIRLACALFVTVLLRLIGVERHVRLIALLIGLGFLIALAGRFAT